MAGEKTEQATPKRKEDERKKGNIFQSTEVVTVFTLIATFYGFSFLAPLIFSTIQKSITDFIMMMGTITELNEEVLTEIFVQSVITFAIAALPLLLIGAAAAIIFAGAQTRFLITFKLVNFKANRISPLAGFKKMFSMRGVVELIKSIIKIVILGVICYNKIMEYMPTMPNLMDMSLQQGATIIGQVIMAIINGVVPIFIFVALADYIFQWWQYEKNLKMSKQEIKEEYKQTEGDPQIKGKIRDKQQQAARNRMMQAVPTADVVIRNPTHFAVAIKYDPKSTLAPIVVAKGMDLVALRIVAIAEENDVATIENVPLAHGLYDAVDIGMQIPEEFYKSVAEVIAFVYNLKHKEIV